MSNLGYIQMSLKDLLLSVSLFCHLASIILCTLILSETLALYKSFTYLLTYLIAVIGVFDAIESLLVVASVGVQLTTTFVSGRQKAMFYDISDISGIVINEAVTMVKHCVLLTLSCLLFKALARP